MIEAVNKAKISNHFFVKEFKFKNIDTLMCAPLLNAYAKAKKEVEFVRKTKCFCTHECFNIVNILFNPKYYPKVLSISKKIKQ